MISDPPGPHPKPPYHPQGGSIGRMIDTAVGYKRDIIGIYKYIYGIWDDTRNIKGEYKDNIHGIKGK